MKMCSRMTIVMACLFASFSVDAVNDGSANPYDKIVARNLFGLKDPPPPPDPESQKPAPPPISLQGFTRIGTRDLVMFKVSQPAKPPQPAQELSKMLGVDEREDGITVLEIDVANATVKFDNNGTVESKNLKDNAAKPSGAAPAPAAAAIAGLQPPQPGSIPSAVPLPTPSPAPTGLQSIPTRTVRTQNTDTALTSQATTGETTRYTPYGGKIASRTAYGPNSPEAIQAAVSRTPEENALLYQANKMRREQAGGSILKLPDHPFLRDHVQPQTPTPGK